MKEEFRMNDHMQDGMAEATRLTRAGRLTEATAMIQRILRGIPVANTSTVASSGIDAPIEATFHVIDEYPPFMPTSKLSGTSRTDRPTKPAQSTHAPGILSGSKQHVRVHPRPVIPNATPASTRSGGQFVDGTYTNSAGTRAYKLYIPSGYRGQALPLVVMLHGCTQTPVTFATGTHMNVLAEEETFFVAYPEQESLANGSKCWNWFQHAHQSRDEGEPSLIAGITQQIMHAYAVDASRVYVAGLSAGGSMAAILAATYPDLYAAVGVHSGLAYGAAHDLPSAFTAMRQGAPQQTRKLATTIPMIVFQGDRDTTVAPINADSLLDQWLSAINVGQSATPAMTIERGQVNGGHAYTRFLYRDTDRRVVAEKWMIHQAGHAWSGGNPGGSFTDPKGPDASAAMLRFFREHPMKK
jgi:poly(hydroxyalkanoate) depolymerase family esterase